MASLWVWIVSKRDKGVEKGIVNIYDSFGKTICRKGCQCLLNVLVMIARGGADVHNMSASCDMYRLLLSGTA